MNEPWFTVAGVTVVRGRKFVRVLVGRYSLTLGWLGPL